MERIKSAPAISLSLAAAIPAAFARAIVSWLRPVNEVSTFRPLSASLLPTAAPMAPGAITATTGVMCPLIFVIPGERGEEPGNHNPGVREYGFRACRFAAPRNDEATL